MAKGQVFKRVEKKYLLTEEKYQAFLAGIEPYMQADDYGLTKILNIYFDTDQFDLVRRSIEKPAYKEKFRIRSYGVPQDDDTVFLEIKKKYDGVVYKRRETLKAWETRKFLAGEKPAKDTQIMREIEYFLNFYQPKPQFFIGYDRVAYFGKEDAELRMTFDRNLRYRRENLRLSAGDQGTTVLPEGTYILEIKVPGAFPMWLSELLSKLEIFQVSFSKYGSIYEDLGVALMQEQIRAARKVRQPVYLPAGVTIMQNRPVYALG